MNKFILKLEFKDTNSEISFDLNKNNLFYGLNGRGKTRILKAIFELCNLDFFKSSTVIINIIDNLNLEYLQINDSNYQNLFEEKTKIESFADDSLNAFISNNKFAINDYIKEFEDLLQIISISYLSERIKVTIQTGNSFLKTKNISLQNFQIWLTQSKKIIRELDNIIRNKIIHENIDEVSIIKKSKINKILNRLQIIYRYILRKLEPSIYNKKIRNKILNFDVEKDKVIKKLKNESAIYISPNIMENINILEQIREEIQDIKLNLGTNTWAYILEKNKDAIIKNDEFKKNLYNLSKNLNIINTTLEKYTNIELSFDNDGNIEVLKNKNDIEFKKLSSGEKRIILLFLYIVFSKEKIILIDEPEISLSLNYQSKFVDDIVRLADNKKIMMATHAPYIYDDCKANGFELIEV
jgi:hypothetical protein